MRKVALVTGASSGIGRGIAQYFLQEGYRVIAIGRHTERLQQTYDQMVEQGYTPDAILLSLDITDSSKLENDLRPVIEKTGQIDVLVNSAGYSKRGTSELPGAELAKMLAVNLTAAFELTQLVVPLMKKQQSGYIINVVSQSGVIARPYLGGYAASKFGLMGMNESLHQELAADNIQVTAICPGLVVTTMTADVEESRRQYMLPVDDIVKTVDYLLNLSSNAAIKSLVLNSRGQLLS